MITFPRDWIGPKNLFPMFHTRKRGKRRTTPYIPRYDQDAIDAARRLREQLNDIRQGGTTTQWEEVIFVNRADFSAVASTASEASLLGGANQQPVLPAFYFDAQKGERRSYIMEASGILGTTSTPTIIFQVRSGTSVGSSSLTGASVGVSAAITTASGVSNKWWYLRLLMTNYTPGLGSGNDTISGAGYVVSPGGFASPFMYPLEPTTPDTATWTQTLDASVTQYINLSITWSASSASNTITCKSLLMHGLN